jgi:hypothetical protein
MTLAELRRQLGELGHLPDETLVVLAKDAEGNHFSPFYEVDRGMYLAETTWSGERYMTEEQRQAQQRPDDWYPAPEGAVSAVFLWPVN